MGSFITRRIASLFLRGCLAVLLGLVWSHLAMAQATLPADGEKQGVQAAKPKPKVKLKREGSGDGQASKDGDFTRVASGSERVLYQNLAYTLTADSITEGTRRAWAHGGARPHLINDHREMVRPQWEGEYPQLFTNNPLVDMLYRIAIADLEMNILRDHQGVYLRVSPDFPKAIFTRDVAYSSELGAAWIFPEIIKAHLQRDRRLRREVGFRCPEGETIPLPGVENLPEALSGNAFFEKYGTHAFARRTDDPCWVVGYFSALCCQAEQAEWKWLVEEFDYFDENFYRHFYDPADGLYFGQASFIDVGGTGYPADYRLQDCLQIKALSTNCLYLAAFERLGKACQHSGFTERVADFERRASRLRDRIRETFLQVDGTLAYFQRPDGTLEPRREQLGTAFCVLWDVLPSTMIPAAVDGYPSNDFGGPIFAPFYDRSKVYHNHGLWPFADTYFCRALEKRARHEPHRELVILRALGNLSRHALWGNFSEMLDYESGGWKTKHARSYIWSAAAYLGVVFHLLAGMEVDDARQVRWRPCLPQSFGGDLEIRGLRLQGSSVDFKITGYGSQVRRCMLDGQPIPLPQLQLDGQPHTLLIELGEPSHHAE
jgi:hypothetical protein